VTHVTFLREVTASHVIVCCYSVSHSSCMISCDINYCVNGSICHFKLPKVVQAHTLGEVGNLGTVLLRVYSGTILPIFIEIGLYLTDNSKIYVGTVFLRHGVYVRLGGPVFLSSGQHFACSWSQVPGRHQHDVH